MLRLRMLSDEQTITTSEAAETLLTQLKSFVATVDDRAKRAKASNHPQEAQRLSALACDMDFNVAEFLAGPIGSPPRALAHLDDLEKRRGADPDAMEKSQALRVAILLEQGHTAQAVEAVRSWRGRFGDKEASLVSRVAFSVRQRIRELSLSPSRQEQAKAWRSTYREFAEQAYALAQQAGSVDYAHHQMLAEAWVETGRSDEALEVFQKLDSEKPNDARNLQGMARCQWLTGHYASAVDLYRRLSEGVSPTEQGPLWWRVQLDMAQCIRQGAGENPRRLGGWASACGNWRPWTPASAAIARIFWCCDRGCLWRRSRISPPPRRMR